MATRRFRQVDVFTSVAFKGNPLAVVLDAEGLSDEQMHAIARWTNLSETTFVLAPTSALADYRVRIFSPGAEFPFAGHPTLGTAHALLEAGLVPRTPGALVQQCAVGLVPLRLGEDGALAFRAPEATCTPLPAARHALLAAALGGAAYTEAVVVDMGIVWLVVRLASADACLAVCPDVRALRELVDSGITGLAMFGPHAPGGPADVEVRCVFTKLGELCEDPVTGSGNACIARLRGEGGEGRDYTARQGTLLQRDGRIAVTFADGAPWIGGHSVTVIDGLISI